MKPADSDQSELLEVGYIGKANGLKGAVTAVFTTNLVETRTAVGSRLLVGDRWLEVASARPHKDRWVVTFAGFESREAAEGLRGSKMSAEPIGDPDELFVHSLIGCSLVDASGVDHGLVVSVVSNPASDLLELESGELVPLTFYDSHGDGIIRVDVPDGLLDGEAIVVERGE